MQLYISADIEGISGIVHAEHTARNGREHDRARLYMTKEVNACIEGAIEMGATNIIVNDSHGTMRNILFEHLDPYAVLISGSPKKYAMVEGLDDTFDAAIFIGYHTRMGSNGILNHTFNGKVIQSIKINGREYGEFGLNAAIAGYHGVPVIMVSGCNLLSIEAKGLVPNIHSAIVKKTINRTSACNISLNNAQNIIKETTKNSIKNKKNIKPFIIDNPLVVEVNFLNSGLADIAEILPFVNRSGPITVTFVSDKITEAYRIIRSLIMIANNSLQ